MPKGVSSFNPERLSEARLARGLTQASLAQMVERDSATVSAWEGGRQSPDWEMLQRVSERLGVRATLFTKQTFSDPSHHYYRSNSSITLALQKKAKARLRWTEIISFELGEWVDFPEPDFPKLEQLALSDITDSFIESAASACRTHWSLGVGPVSNVTEVLEAAGVVVVRDELGGVKMDGVSVWFGDRPFVLLAADKASAVRSRFDAAHELGHIVLHRRVDPDALSPVEYSEMERQAHLFASCFLLPPEGFLRELKRLDLDGFVELKRRWKSSISSMIMACERQYVITPAYKAQLFRYMSARGWRKQEPLDDVIVPEAPDALREAVDLVISAGKYGRDELCDLVGLNAADVEVLCGLPRGYLQREAAAVIKLRPF